MPAIAAAGSEKNGAQWIPLVGLGAAALLQPLNISMVTIGLPVIRDGFGASASAGPWVMTVYIIGLAIGQPIAGKFIDRIDRKHAFLLGAAYFGVSSMLCALAWDFPSLLFGRFNQGLGTALVMPTVVAIVRAEFPRDRRAAAMGVIFSLYSLAGLTGPPLGGLFAATIGWRAIFGLSAAMGAAAVGIGMRYIPARPPARTGPLRFDYAGALLLIMGLLSLIMFVSLAPKGFDPAVGMGSLLVAGLILVGLFVKRQLTAVSPLVELRFFSIPPFAYATASLACSSVAVFTAFIAVSLFAVDIRGFSPGQAGLVLMAPGFVMIGLGPICGRLSDKVGRRWPSVVGTAVVGISMVLLGLASETSSIWYLVLAMMVHGTGLAISLAPIQTAAVEACPESLAGMASGVTTTVRSFGSVLGASLVGGLVALGGVGFTTLFVVGGILSFVGAALALGIHRHAVPVNEFDLGRPQG